jgi:hypothetical protein
MLIRRFVPFATIGLLVAFGTSIGAQGNVRSGGLGQLIFDGKVRLQITDVKAATGTSYNPYAPPEGQHYVVVHGTMRNGVNTRLAITPYTATLYDASGAAVAATNVPPIDSNAGISDIVTHNGGTYDVAPGAGVRIQFAFAVPAGFVPASVTLRPRDAGWGTFNVKFVTVAVKPTNKPGGTYQANAVSGGFNVWLTDGVVAIRVTSFAAPPAKSYGIYSIGADKHYMIVKATLRNVGKTTASETWYTPSLADASGVTIGPENVPNISTTADIPEIVSLNGTAYNIKPQGTWKLQIPFAVPNDFTPAKLVLLPYAKGAWKAFRITLPAAP